MRIALAWVDPADPTDRAVAVNLARELTRLGHRVILVGPRRRGEPGRGVVAGFRLYRVTEPSGVAALRALHERERVDLWHVHVFGRSHRALAEAARRGRFRILATFHLVLEDYLRFAGGVRGLRSLLNACERVTTVSRFSRRELERLLPEWKNRSTVIYNGTDAVDGRTPENGRPFGLCVGRLAPYKGQDILLMAFAKALEETPRLRLIVAGRDQTQGGMATLARALGVSDRVSFTGGLSPEKVRSLIRNCRLVVLPSRRENFPLALLEAMAAGKAVLASRTGGVPEMLRDGVEGVLVPPGSVDALAEGLVRLNRDTLLISRLGKAARKRSREFSWRRAALAYDRLYRAPAKARRSAGTRSKK